jgi:hypothetical protein
MHSILVIAIILAIILPLAGLVLADGPMITVSTPPDGSVSTTRDVPVEGCCTAPARTLVLGPSELGGHPGTNMQWRSGALVMRPVKHFSDDFSGVGLDPARWVIMRNTGILTVSGGVLTIAYENYTSLAGLVRSVRDIAPDDREWRAEFRMKFDYLGYEGGGGGLSGGATDPLSSQMAAWGKYTWMGDPEWLVYSNGNSYFNGTNDGAFHTYALGYSPARSEGEVFMDGDSLATVPMANIPDIFWFGTPDTGAYYYSTSVVVDYADVWTEGGSWTSRTYDLSHLTSVDDVQATWTSTHAGSARVDVQARTSVDNVTWGAWTAMGQGGASMQARYLQVRTFTSLQGVKTEAANVSVASFKVLYHDPVTSVEVRRSGGDWVAATGLEEWSAHLALEEDENTIEVRANDTAGHLAFTSLVVVVDTTAPVGTVRILGDRQYYNDLNVKLELNATDRYGIEYVQVSNAPDMFNRQTFYYSKTLSWRLDGLDGAVPVYVRFVDSHGLLSDIATDSIIYDAVPPIGTVTINGGREYTPSTTVRLDLEYSDTRGVAKVEVSNAADFPPSSTVNVTGKVVDPWELQADGDGPRSVYMRLTDLAGNVKVAGDTIELYAPKRIGSVVIEDGAPYTSETFVDLRIDCPPEVRPQRMQLSADGTFTGEWENFQRDKRWILSPGDGPKAVWARFEDFRGIYSLPVNDTIILDTVAPKVTVAIEGGADFTIVTDLTVEVSWEDASTPGRMWVTEDGRFDLVQPRPFAATFNWTVGAWEGRHHIYVQLDDGAGNLGSGEGEIYFATRSPALKLSLPGGGFTNGLSTLEVAAIVADDYGWSEVQLAFGTDPPADAPWLHVGGSQPLLLAIPTGTAGGIYEVRGRCRSAAGLVSQVTTVNVTVDLVAPDVEILAPAEDAQIRQSGLAVLVEFTAQDPSGIKSIHISLDGGNWSTIRVTDRRIEVVLGGTGRHNIAVRCLDKAGNEATATTSFSLERRSAVVAGGGAFLILLVLIVILAIVIALAYRRSRSRTRTRAGPRSPPPPAHAAPAPSTAPEGAVAPRPQTPVGAAQPQPPPAQPETSGEIVGWEEI